MKLDMASITTWALYALIGALAFAACLTIIGSIAFWKTEKGAAKTFSLLLERSNVLQMLTVILIVAAATLLRLADAINSEAIVSILSGIAGYVLGGVGFGRQKDKEEPSD